MATFTTGETIGPLNFCQIFLTFFLVVKTIDQSIIYKL